MSDFTATLLAANRSRRVRVCVVGDVIRDQYVTGTVGRMSQEAPGVPILSGGEVVEVPGGAGNAARQLQHWNADVTLLGLADYETQHATARCDLHCRYCMMARNPIKRRFFAGGQLLLRQDVEEEGYGLDAPALQQHRAILLDDLNELLRDGLDAVLISDYRKGVFDGPFLRQIIDACRKAGVPVVADPKGHPLDYEGCSVLKPNASWLRQHGGPFGYPENCAFFQHKGICKAMVCTRGPLPPRGFSGDHLFRCRESSRPTPVRSTIGAGDCFAAHLTLYFAHGFGDILHAAEFAHSAGRAYVGGEHGRPVLPCEALADLDSAGAKVMSVVELRQVLDARHAGGWVILISGCFDLLHAGHLWTLQLARQQGGCLVVALNSDESVRRLKGPGRPIVPEAGRARQLAALSCVDYVITFGEDTPAALLDGLPPVYLVKGAEWVGREADVPCAGHPNVRGVLVAPPSPFPDHTTDLLARLTAPATGRGR